jgi:hypothetical protein
MIKAVIRLLTLLVATSSKTATGPGSLLAVSSADPDHVRQPPTL